MLRHRIDIEPEHGTSFLPSMHGWRETIPVYLWHCDSDQYWYFTVEEKANWQVEVGRYETPVTAIKGIEQWAKDRGFNVAWEAMRFEVSRFIPDVQLEKVDDAVQE